jgi:hypothetical protein
MFHKMKSISSKMKPENPPEGSGVLWSLPKKI